MATWPSGTGPVGATCLATWPKREASTISPGAIAVVATRGAIAALTWLSAPAGTPRLTTVCATISFCANASRADVPCGTGAWAMKTCWVACPATARASACWA